jgi:hypothetical protein
MNQQAAFEVSDQEKKRRIVIFKDCINAIEYRGQEEHQTVILYLSGGHALHLSPEESQQFIDQKKKQGPSMGF